MGVVIPFPVPESPSEKPVWLQQTLDGQEIKHPAPTRTHIGPHEREVLRALGFGSLSSTQAGTICHDVRGHCGYRVPYGEWNVRGSRYMGGGCCPYAVSEGTEVMKRLKRRGFVEKIGGLWYAAPAWGQSWKEAQ